MRAIQLLLLGAILLAVMSVAFELHQLNRAFALPAMFSDAFVSDMKTRETRAQRNQRLQRQTQDNIDDAAAILAAPVRAKGKPVTTATPTAPPRDQQPHR